MSDTRLDERGYTEPVSFRDSKRIIIIVDALASARGTDRSGMYRLAIRYWLAANSQLTAEEKKALGVTPTQKAQGAGSS